MVSRDLPNLFITIELILFIQYGVGTDPESARKDMESNQDRIAAEAGTRALQMLAADPNYNKMSPAIAEAFERQMQRQKGSFCPISFLLPEQVPGSVSHCGDVCGYPLAYNEYFQASKRLAGPERPSGSGHPGTSNGTKGGGFVGRLEFLYM